MRYTPGRSGSFLRVAWSSGVTLRCYGTRREGAPGAPGFVAALSARPEVPWVGQDDRLALARLGAARGGARVGSAEIEPEGARSLTAEPGRDRVAARPAERARVDAGVPTTAAPRERH